MTGADADLLLLRRYCREKDSEAFAQLVRRYADLVYSAALRVLGDPARAEDVSQETFFRLLQRPHAVTQSLGGWLHRTATTIAIDRIRSDSARQERENHYEQLNLRETSEWHEISPIVDECLLELPGDARELLVGHFLQKKTLREMAEQRNISVATASRHLQVALAAVRQKLRQKGVLVPSAILATLLVDNAVQAAPPALMAELGKVSLVGAAAAPTGVGATAAAASTMPPMMVLTWGTLALSVVCGAAAVLVFVMALVEDQPTPAARRSAARQAVDEVQSRSDAHFYVLPWTRAAAEMDPRRVVAFQVPSAASSDPLSVVYADGHTVSVSRTQLSQELYGQTGKTLDDWLAQKTTSKPAGP